MKTVKIPWAEFLSYAMDTVESKFPGAGKPVMMKRHGYEPDGECYETPDYVEIEIP